MGAFRAVLCRFAITASAAGLAMVGMAAPAAAGQDVVGSVPGATGSFKAGGEQEYIWICDTAADGHTARTYITWGDNAYYVEDGTADGVCNYAPVSVPEGRPIVINVCVVNVQCSGFKDGVA